MSLKDTRSAKALQLSTDIQNIFKKYATGNNLTLEQANNILKSEWDEIANAIFKRVEEWIEGSKKKITTITTAPSGTWISEDEPTSGSGIIIG